MPLSPQEFADEQDNVLFIAIKQNQWDRVRDLLLLSKITPSNTSTDTKQPHQLLLQEQDTNENTPLHVAIGFQASDDILLAMINMHPQACQVHGANEWLPLHVASMYGVSRRVMMALIEAFPSGLDDKGCGGIKGRTPRHFKDRFPHNTDLLEK